MTKHINETTLEEISILEFSDFLQDRLHRKKCRKIQQNNQKDTTYVKE